MPNNDPASKQSSSEADASGNEKDGEGRGSSSSRNDDATLETVPDLSRQIVKDVDAVDGESVDLDGLMEHISQLLDIIEGKTSSPQRQRLAEDYFPTTSKIFTKLKKFLSQAKDVIPGEAIKTAVNVVLKGMGAPDLITTPFVLIANILERVGDVGDNEKECISLLKKIFFLAKLVKQFQERHQLMETNGIIGVVKEAIELIVEGSILCCTQMQSSRFSKFSAAFVNKEELSKFRQKLRDMYTHMNAQMGMSLYDVNVPKKPRLSRGYPEHAVGMEEPVKEVLQLLEWGSGKEAVAVILHGFGGMGKTTLGDAVFSQANFEGCKYSEVRLFKDIESKPDVIELQKCILKDLMGPEETVPEIRKYEDGQRELGDILAKVPAFLYIDNVLGEKELEQLLPKDVTKSKKLRLLFTARDQDVRRAFPRKTFYKIYDMKTISNSTAMSFFDDMKERLNSSQINDLINICGGVPLMLTLVAKVLSFEEDKQKAYYKVMQDKQNVNALTYRGAKEEYFFAYDSLPDECKDPFLDVCFFFKGWDWDTVADIVGEDQLDILEKRALVTKGIDSAASVHDVILTIGYQKAEGTRFKFTSSSQFDEFPYQDEEKDIKGIWFGENKDPCTILASKLESMCKSLRVVDLGNLTKVEGQCNKIFENLIYFQGGITQLPFDVSKIKNLRYLKFEPQDLALPKMPSSLRHMEFDGRLQSPSFEISSICLQQLGNLRILRLVKFAELKNLPERIGDQLKVLQELSLSHCKSLKKLPASISCLQSLTLLRMDYCSSLGQLAKDFGSLNSLQELNLEGCAGLTTLPSNFEKLSSLRSLNLSYCKNLEDLPRGLGNLSSLVALNFRNCLKLRSIPDSIGQLKLTASFMDMSDCSSLTELPDGFCNLSFITNLELRMCTGLHRLPTRFGELASLRRLGLRQCSSLERLPESFGQLRCLETLVMMRCRSLEELCNDFHCLTSLQFLNLSGCKSLKKLSEDFHFLPSLQHLNLSYCAMLEGKSMDNVLKIVDIEKSGMLLDRWAEIQGESDEASLFREKVLTGQAIYRENIEMRMLSQLEFLFSEGPEKPFHPSAPLLLVVFDRFNVFNNNY